MTIERLLPRALDPKNSNETVTLMNALIAKTHLDRPLARRLGWRGVRPSFTHIPSWTARVAANENTFGLAFLEETHDQDMIVGRFAVFVFPHKDGQWIKSLSTATKNIIADEHYEDYLREFSANIDSFQELYLGEIEWVVSFDGQSNVLTLTTVSGDCIQSSRLTLPIYNVLVHSLIEASEDQPEYIVNFEPFENESARQINFSTAFGAYRGRLPGHRLTCLPLKHKASADEERQLPIVHVLSGFLGAGKTTFLKAWLEFLNSRERFTGVIQNEFGEVDLDSLCLKGETQVEAIDEGCVCCSLADSLRPGLLRLMQTTPAEQFILETTGVADPGNVITSLTALNDIVTPGLVITLVDSYDLVTHPLQWDDCHRQQIEAADILIASKADAVEESQLKELIKKLHQINEQAMILPAYHGEIPFGLIDNFYVKWYDYQHQPQPSLQIKKAEKPLFKRRWGTMLKPTSFASRFQTATIYLKNPLSTEELKTIIDTAGSRIQRIKGVVSLENEGDTVIQYAAGVLATEAVPDAFDKKTERYLVIIGESLKEPLLPKGAKFQIRQSVQDI